MGADDDGISDEALLAGIAVGDEGAGLTFVRRYQHRLWGLAVGVIGDARTAEDVAQEAFVRIFRHAVVFDPRRGSVSAWALTITRNLAIHAIRVRRGVPTDPDDQVFFQLTSREGQPEEALVTADAVARARVALAGLPDGQRRAIVLAAMYGRTAQEVALAEGIPLDREEPDQDGDGQAAGNSGDGGRRVMSDHAEDRTACEAIREDLGELALGLLSDRRRSEVLAHLENCPWCSTELAELSLVADTLLQLAPEAEPPFGFEQRLAVRLSADPPRRAPHRYRRAGWVAAAAGVAILAGFGLGAALMGPRSPGTSPSTAANLTSATLDSRGHSVGEVVISAGKPGWLFMTLDHGSWSGPVTCQIVLSDGAVQVTGHFQVADGHGMWAAPLKTKASAVKSAELVAQNGTVMASAHLTR